ncbi:MAG: hypothetical protein M1484_04900 [Patescibacteria group bacterium]|nr:hypothetical protein [Patescibacteria group bacterium]
MKEAVFVLHFYQPPTQALGLTQWVLQTCYLPILDRLLETPKAKMTFNISGCLLLQLKAIPNHDFFGKLKSLSDRGQIEFLASPAFHPLIPLTPPEVVRDQLGENRVILSDTVGATPVAGLFSPELAVSQDCQPLFGSFDFAVVDETANVPQSQKFLVASRQITEIIRSYPTELSAEKFINYVLKATNLPAGRQGSKLTAVIVSDAEVFGHHYTERINFFHELIQSEQMSFIKASEAVKKMPPASTGVKIATSSWQPGGLSLWTKTPLQKKYLALTGSVYSQIKTSDNTVVRDHFNRGTSSCHLYWLSNKPWWHPDLVEAGATNLIRAVRSLAIPHAQKLPSEKLYHSLVTAIWRYHWSGRVEKNYQLYDQQRRKILLALPRL